MLPTLQGRFLLVKLMTSAGHGDNIDVGRVALFGYEGEVEASASAFASASAESACSGTGPSFSLFVL